MDTIILDVGFLIHNLLNFPSQVNLRLTSKHFATNYHTTNLYDLPDRNKLTTAILKNYPHAIKLCISYNQNIHSINHMTKLRLLSARGPTIANDELVGLRELRALFVSGNYRVHDVNHLTGLQLLGASGQSGIGDNGLRKLVNLIELY